MEPILHLLGLCSDNQSHIDLMDLLFGGIFAGGILTSIKYYSYGIKLYIKSLLTKNKTHE